MPELTPEQKAEINAANEVLTRAYRLTFSSPTGQEVLIDLMKFCRFRVPIETKEDEGQRRVFLRIENFMNFTPEQLRRLYSGSSFTTPPTGEDR